jgi:hypothetical protein
VIAVRDNAGSARQETPDEAAMPEPRRRDGAWRIMNADVPALGAEQIARSPAADLIQDDEVVILLLRPSVLYILLGSLGSLVFIALITFILAWISRLSWVGAGWNDTMAFGFGATLAIIRLSWQGLEWYSRLYILTDRRIIRRMGVLRVAVFETKIKNIQHTSVFRSVRERLFGLGSIGFATAGSDVFEAFWVMIDRPFHIHRIVVRAIEKYG